MDISCILPDFLVLALRIACMTLEGFQSYQQTYKKITLLRVIPTMTFQNSLLTPLLSEAFEL